MGCCLSCCPVDFAFRFRFTLLPLVDIVKMKVKEEAKGQPNKKGELNEWGWGWGVEGGFAPAAVAARPVCAKQMGKLNGASSPPPISHNVLIWN
jgi:hypothetical protein